MKDPSLESQLLTIVRELKVLEHRRTLLQNRENANSRTLQAELAERIDEKLLRRAVLESLIANRDQPQSTPDAAREAEYEPNPATGDDVKPL